MDLTNPSVSGPGAIVLAVLTYLLKIYLDTRKDKREDVTARRSSESSIVETTKSLIDLLREHIKTLNGDLQSETIRRKDAEQKSWALEQANAELRSQLERSRNENAPAWREETEYGQDAGYGGSYPVQPSNGPRGRHWLGDPYSDSGN